MKKVASASSEMTQSGYSTRPAISAYDIFHEFIVLDGEEVDVSGVFSLECYTRWLYTRPVPDSVRQPEQTFHRTIVAHVRGADSRKPFSPEVERQLLKRLRDARFNAWDKCFPDKNRFNVGKRGFKHLGYHEANYNNSSASISAEETETEGKKKPRCPRKANKATKRSRDSVASGESDGDEDDDDNAYTLQLELPASYMKNEDIDGLSLVSYEDHKITSSKTSGGYLIGEEVIAKEYLAVFLGCPFQRTKDMDYESPLEVYAPPNRDMAITPWDEMWRVLHKIEYPSYIDVLSNTAKRHFNMDLFPPALIFMMKQPVPKGDIRFDYSFIFPENGGISFATDRPVGKVKLDLWKSCFVDACPIAKKILKYNPAGDFIYTWHASLLELWYGAIYAFDKVPTCQTYWKRSFRKLGDGSVAFFLTRNVPTENCNFLYMDIQDQSDMFRDVLEKPFFI